MKALFKEIISRIHEQLIEPYKGGDEFVEFDASEFAAYKRYDKAYPDRFRVKYDENLNRIWK
jgi:hypothetical protein